MKSAEIPVNLRTNPPENPTTMKLPILALLLSLTPAQADMGSIPAKKGTKITEPTQDAIIAWNGKEQLLYLQTKLAASQATAVLEVMPLPARPTVEASDIGIFKRTRFLAPHPPTPKNQSSSDPFSSPQPGGRVVETKQIGAHHLQTVELLNPETFQSWVTKEFLSQYPDTEIPKNLLQVIQEYIQDGYTWFLFDQIDLTTAPTKKIPLKIRFATDVLYYPMRITRTEKGKTTVSLYIFTNQLFTAENCIGIPRSEIKVLGKPKQIPADKLNWIDPPIYNLLGKPKSANLRQWQIKGPIDSFTKDLLVKSNMKKAE